MMPPHMALMLMFALFCLAQPVTYLVAWRPGFAAGFESGRLARIVSDVTRYRVDGDVELYVNGYWWGKAEIPFVEQSLCKARVEQWARRHKLNWRLRCPAIIGGVAAVIPPGQPRPKKQPKGKRK